MTPALTLEELQNWNEESADYWRARLDAEPALLELPCGIGGSANVQAFVAHIWSVELRWAQRLAEIPVLAKEDTPTGPLPALFALHREASAIYSRLLADSTQDWDSIMNLDLPWLPQQARTPSRRKVLAHAFFHGQRHYAQLATLLRNAGFPSDFKGDLLFARTIR
jgi:uncharacterized damage-inducible protein DinB